jgi:hypothetical protein
MPTNIDRLLAKHTKVESGCWEWKGYKNQFGYGRAMITIRPKEIKLMAVHRLAWERANIGREIPKGMVIMHSCDNRACINPAHLSLGTYSENNRDCYARGRHPFKRKSAKQPSQDIGRQNGAGIDI